jgi:hypothetical protein
MKEFDIELEERNVQSEVKNSFDNNSDLFINEVSQFKDEELGKTWIDTLNNLTTQFQNIKDKQLSESGRIKKEKEEAKNSKEYKLFGMNPLVVIAVSFSVILGGSIAIIKIKS